MQSKRVTFPGGSDHELVGRWEYPDDEPPTHTAVFASCFTCVKDLKGARRICRRLTEHGVGVLRFDYTGIGESKGDFAETTFANKVADVVAAASFVQKEFAAPTLLIGHSIGGSASLVAEQYVPSTKLLVTVNSPAATDHLGKMILDAKPGVSDEAPAEMSFAGGRPVRVSRGLAESLIDADIESVARGLSAHAMIFQATNDEMLGTRHAGRIFAAAPNPKSLIQLQHADHLLIEREADAHFVADVVAAWLRGNV